MEAVETLRRWVGEAKRVVYIAGAGLSVASGIRPYRGAPNAVWAEFVTDWGTVRKFREDPAAWWATFWLKSHGDIFKEAIEPNAGHRALSQLCASCEAVLITQNID